MPTPDSGATSPPPVAAPENGILKRAVNWIGFLIALDLIGAGVVRLQTGEPPTVFGDLSKVGITILGTVVAERLARQYLDRRH